MISIVRATLIRHTRFAHTNVMSDSHSPAPSQDREPSPSLQQIRAAIAGIRFGSVEIVIHDGKVVQIERKEKVRLQKGGT